MEREREIESTQISQMEIYLQSQITLLGIAKALHLAAEFTLLDSEATEFADH